MCKLWRETELSGCMVPLQGDSSRELPGISLAGPEMETKHLQQLGLHDFMIGFVFCMFSTLLSCCSLPGFFFDDSTCWPEDQAPTLNDQPLICSSYSTCRHEYTIFPSNYTKSQGPPLFGKPHMSSAPEAGPEKELENKSPTISESRALGF